MNPGIVTLTNVLRSQGFTTAAFVSADAISGKYGSWSGFDIFDETLRLRDSDVDRVGARADRWLAENKDQRFFLFIQTYEVHAPGTHSDLLPDLKVGKLSPAERASAAYDGDLRYTD